MFSKKKDKFMVQLEEMVFNLDRAAVEFGKMDFNTHLRSARFRRYKSVSDLKTFDSTDREDRFCEVGIQFFEYRLTETDRKTGNHTLDNSADRVAFCDFLIQVAFGFFCSFSVRETEPVVLDFRKIHALRGYLYRSD